MSFCHVAFTESGKHVVFVTETSRQYKYYCHFKCNREVPTVWIIIRDLSTTHFVKARWQVVYYCHVAWNEVRSGEIPTVIHTKKEDIRLLFYITLIFFILIQHSFSLLQCNLTHYIFAYLDIVRCGYFGCTCYA